MQSIARGNPRVPSPGSLRPFTPPDLSSIPHMDGTPPQGSGVRSNSSFNSGRANDGTQEQSTGPYIIGSPIDLGNIDNVDNIGLRIANPLASESRRTCEHIELQEAAALPESTSEGEPPTVSIAFGLGDSLGECFHH